MEFLRTSLNHNVQTIFNWFFEGFIGVQFFYVLSGFVIAYSFAARKGSMDFGKFLFFRAARIYPIHWLTMLAAIYLTGLPGEGFDAVLKLLTNAALMQSFVPRFDYYFGFNAVSWSISNEMFFYLTFCVLVAMSTRAILVGAVLLLAVIVINLLAAPQADGYLLYINPFFRLIDFLTGVLLYRLFLARPLTLSRSEATLAEVGSIALVGIFIIVAMTKDVPLPWRWDIYYIPPIAIMVFVFAHQKGAVSDFLSARILVLLGDASFALYMIHQMLMSLMPSIANPAIVRFKDFAQSATIIMVACIVLSVVLHLCFEKPINEMLRRWWVSRRPTPKALEVSSGAWASVASDQMEKPIRSSSS